jgi:hypothetical protein
MKFLSLNDKGLGNLIKILYLHILVEKEKHDVLIIQETMWKVDLIIGSLKKLFINWDFHWVDACGMS